MDNDNKIKAKASGKGSVVNAEQRHKEVLLFLNDELNRLQTVNSTNSYDLEKEYAKTKKNKSPFVFLLLFISILVVILAAWGITAGINKQNEHITVNLQEFEGLNIKNLLDSVSKVQANYDTAMKNKMNIISDKDIALRKAEEKRDSDLFLIDSLNLDKGDADKRKTQVQEEYENAVVLVNQVYDPQLDLAEKELAEYKKQLDEYDTAKLEAARQQEQALDSERRVHQLEIEKVSKDYEKRISEIQNAYAQERKNNAEQIRRSVTEVSQKYIDEISRLDPDLRNHSAKSLVDELLVKEAVDFDALAFAQENEIEDETIVSALGQYQTYYEQYSSVREPMERIPYKNTLPQFLKVSKNLVGDMGKTFEDTILKVNEEKQELNGRIDELNKKVSGLNAQIDKIRKDNEAEKQQLKEDFLAEKAELAKDYTDIYDGILISAKATAVVISAHSKEEIRIYVLPDHRNHITENGVGAEIKAGKSVKGVIKPIPGEPGFYLFENALDKNGNPVDFDFSLIQAGQIVKVSSK